MSQWTTQESQSQMYRPTYLGKRSRSVGGGGSSSSSSKRGGRASSATSVKKAVKQTPKAIIAKVVRDLAEKKSFNTDPVLMGFSSRNTFMSPNDGSGPPPVLQAHNLCAPLNITSQGAGAGDRIGNKIYIHDYSIRMNFTVNKTYLSSATFLPGVVQVWIGRVKSDPARSPTMTDMTRLYDDGGGSVNASDGTMLATLRDNNTDYFDIVAYRKFWLGGSSASTGVGGPFYGNNNFSAQKTIIIKNLLKGKVTFNDTTNSQNDKFLFMWYTFTTLDSTALTVSVPVDGQYYISGHFSDV